VSKENAEIVRRAIEAGNEKDWQRAAEILAPDAEWRGSSEHPDRRTVVGPDAAVEHLRARQDVVSSVLHLERVVDRDEKVVAIGHLRASAVSSEADVRTPFALVFTFRDGAVVRVEEFRNHAEALTAAGLEE
jgi:ketosteroid isomerase-like protein